GLYHGKVKAMMDDKGGRVTEAPPSTPVEVLGLTGVPEAGDEFFVVKDEKKARTLSLLKQEEKRQKNLRAAQRVSLEHLYQQIKDGDIKALKIILKADVQGSVEALQKSLENLSTEEVKLKAVHVGVGNINESDVMLAVVANAVIIGFHVKIDPKAEETSKKERVDVRRYDVIYEAINDITAAMEGLLEPAIKEVFQGRVKVRQVFKISKIGNVGGSIVIKGTISRSNPVRLMRNNTEIYRGRLRSLKRFKNDVREVTDGMECGIALEGHNDIKPGDIIESFIIEKTARRLDSRKK
ncbi:MAG: translation initiation factor IF-2, partial [Candidatus Omnitrophica bacterium]|nr:translation initiation factor IF-2 [Candidatus Omnitrophota bacterium]